MSTIVKFIHASLPNAHQYHQWLLEQSFFDVCGLVYIYILYCVNYTFAVMLDLAA